MSQSRNELGVRRVDESRWLKVEIIGARAREEVYGIQDRDTDQEDLRRERLDGRSIDY